MNRKLAAVIQEKPIPRQSSFNYVNRVAESFRRSPSVTHLRVRATLSINEIESVEFFLQPSKLHSPRDALPTCRRNLARRTRKLKQTFQTPDSFDISRIYESLRVL